MQEAFRVPIGLRPGQATRTVSRAFDDALEAAGGTLPAWLVLLNLTIGTPASQREPTEAGEAAFGRLQPAAIAFDARLRAARLR